MTKPLNKRPTITELEANFEQEVAWAESKYGPHVIGRLTGRGRPRKGTAVEPTEPHSIRIQPSLWANVQAQAQALNISTNAALQLALRDWARKHKAG